ncbi:MAG TPA: hypothetical protein VML91_02780 [Burkholderiales bacterium]|nr:hypothetical protein [Burkholderiales bacterium]
MKTYPLHLQSAAQYERIEGVASFVGEDASGQFGILARHDRFITTLVPGLARYRTGREPWQYVALPGGVLDFVGGELYVTTGRYARDPDYRRMRALLRERLLAEEEGLRALKMSVRRLEEELFRRLYDLERRGSGR